MPRLTAPLFLLASLLVSREAIADLFVFTGTVTSVDDPFGALSGLAAVGAPVGGSFYFNDAPVTGSLLTPGSPSYQTFSPDPHVTDYTNQRSFFPGLTGLALNINGVGERSAPDSTTSLFIGDQVPAGTLSSPAGDFFRYFDQITYPPGGRDALANYSVFDDTDYDPYPTAALTLADPTGAAFSSQDFTHGHLPLSTLTGRTGEFSAFDGNGEYEGSLFSVQFRIDSIRAVPEPSGLALLAAAGVALAAPRAWRRGRPLGIPRAS